MKGVMDKQISCMTLIGVHSPMQLLLWYICTYLCMYVCMYVCVCVCVYVCMYVCVCVSTAQP